MTMTAFPLQQPASKLKGRDRQLLIEHLKSFRQQARRGEAERRAATRRGAKLAKGKMWEEGITSGRLPITANQAISLGESFISQILHGLPVPEIQPINSYNDDAAALLEGAILTNIKNDRLIPHLKSAMRMAFFSYPTMQYTYWDPEARNGIGDFTTRSIPADRQIVDNKYWQLRSGKFCGFTEKMTRAQLVMLYPDKIKEIESAAQFTPTEKPGMPADPWDAPFHQGRPGQLSRLVADNQGQFVGKTTIKVGGRNVPSDAAMLEEIEAEFIWYRDTTPVTRQKPKLDANGNPIYEHERHPETGDLLFDFHGFEVRNDPDVGPRYVANIKPKKKPVMVPVVERLYKQWRHVASIPGDEIILWDVNWEGPLPLWSVRTSYPLNEYWHEGQGLRLASLSIARNILWTIIFQRLKLSLGGTWLASFRSGLKRQKLTPEDGQVFYGKNIGQDDVRQFPVQPLDVSYLSVLHEIESEMMKLIGISPVQQGRSAGRVDNQATYDKLIEQAGSAVVDAAQLLETSLCDYAEIAMFYVQTMYTHEHFVEYEAEDGQISWRQASRVAVQGKYAVSIDTVAMMAHSESAQRQLAQEGAQLGLYTLPMMAKLGRFPQWRRALRQKMAMANDPTKAPLIGPAGSPPGKIAQKPGSSGNRSHHKQNSS